MHDAMGVRHETGEQAKVLNQMIDQWIEVSEKEDANGKVKKNETVIFPRYHQLDVLRKVLADVKEHGSSLNYLLQHSAGSGKTNEIAWLAHRLASLHSADNKIIFDNIIICTDRVVVDRQLQQAVLGIEHKEGLIRVMDNQCNSTDLANALGGNTRLLLRRFRSSRTSWIVSKA